MPNTKHIHAGNWGGVIYTFCNRGRTPQEMISIWDIDECDPATLCPECASRLENFGFSEIAERLGLLREK